MLKRAAKAEGKKLEQATENKTKHVFIFTMFNRVCNPQTTRANAKIRVQEEQKKPFAER